MTNKKTNTNDVLLTLDDLINKKLQKKSTEVKYETIRASKLKGNLKFRIPNDDEVFELMDDVRENNKTKALKATFIKLIYNQCPMLHEKTLLDAYGIDGNPEDIVDVLFNNADIFRIGNKFSSESDLDEKEEEIKN
ncbi:hypothetical protein K2F43_06110 [Clostridium estertheticum]|uniref:hypothetical protein n=1 Tax=Clostridium estertheticum TaxID=238834 RepID=UPI001C6F315C|nr:hypothetical protein [Clostridium estertheticum]MBW9170780.1 hypothetical protein [Clostridium estertheticum]WLC74381.1 hypothetical protein KTC99_16645 [Clostridium estertheticum]